MEMTPQPYPLFLAYVEENQFSTGRVVGWIVKSDDSDLPEADPVVAWNDDDGGTRLVCVRRVSGNTRVFFAETEGEAQSKAMRHRT